MSDAILLSQETYDRLMAMLEKWEDGQIIEPGTDLQTEESGTGYQKIGVNVTDILQDILPSGGGGTIGTLEADVCIDGSPETHTFLILD